MLPLYAKHIVLGSNKRFLSVCLSVNTCPTLAHTKVDKTTDLLSVGEVVVLPD